MTTLTREQWGKERADWWSAGQAVRQQIIGAATEKMLDLAGVQGGSRVLDVAAGTGESTLMAALRVGGRGYVLATPGTPIQHKPSPGIDTPNVQR
jgi:hypothetical protein